MITTRAELDYYAILRVSSEASSEEITRNYRILVQLLHPDKHSQAPEAVRARAQEEMKLLNEAYDVLSDPQKRAAYDAAIAEEPKVDSTTVEAMLRFDPWDELDESFGPVEPLVETYDYPKIALDTKVLSAGVIKRGTQVPLGFTITNLGTGTLVGTLQCTESWLSVSRNFSGNQLKIAVTLDTRDLVNGRIYAGSIVLSSNGGDEKITVLVGTKGGFLQAGVSQDVYDLTLARHYKEAGMWDKAIGLLTKIAKLPAEGQQWLIEARYSKGRELMDMTAFWEAADCFRQILETPPRTEAVSPLDPLRRDVYLRLAFCHSLTALVFRAARMFARATSEMAAGLAIYMKAESEPALTISTSDESALHLRPPDIDHDRAEWLASAAMADCCWPTEAHDTSRSNWAPFILPKRNLLALWSAQFPSKVVGVCTSFDTVFAVLEPGAVVALDILTGRERWRYKLPAKTGAAPTYADGFVLFGVDDRKLCCLDAYRGEVVWEFPAGGKVRCTPLVHSGVVYFTSGDKKCYAVNISGGYKIWDSQLGGWLEGGLIESAALAINQGVLLYADAGHIRGIDVATGRKVWEKSPGASTTLGSGGIRTCTYDGTILALGVRKSKFGEKRSMLTGTLMCFDIRNGEQKWALEVRTEPEEEPDCRAQPLATIPQGVRYNNAALCLAGHGKWLYAVGIEDARTGEIWRKDTKSSVWSSYDYMVAGRKVWLFVDRGKSKNVSVLDVGSGKEELTFDVPWVGKAKVIAGGGLLYLMRDRDIIALG